ncbi:MAG: cardiolipin synthase [Bacteroidaceae bacterium]
MEWNHIIDLGLMLLWNSLKYGAIVFTIIVVLLENKNPVKTMAWIVVIWFLPVIGILFYVFFGRSTRKARIISKKSYNRLLKRPMAEYQKHELPILPPDQKQLAALFYHTNQNLVCSGNKVDILTDGYSFLQLLIHEISKAKSYIHLQYYIFEDDAVGRLIRDLLIDKSREGVEVKVLYDDVGCWNVPKHFFERMSENGIEIRSFLKVFFPYFTSKVNYRNHRKITVIDGCVGFVGGMNLAERYIKGFSWGAWRDTHLCLRGRAVHGLQTSFLLDWYFADQTLLTSPKYFPRLEEEGDSIVQIVTSEPVSPWKGIMQGLTLAITSSKQYFWIQTPYFIPTEPILSALQNAALAGVDVRLMIPGKPDAMITYLGTCSYLKDVLEAGVKIYLYQQGFIHSKLMVSDDILSTVGSTNMDFRSFEHNFEVNAFFFDASTALRMKQIFLQDQKECTQLFLRNWENRPRIQKFKESVVRLLSPLL